MSDVEREFDDKLLDLHLGRLPEAERADLERQIARDERLASRNEAVAEIFAVLGAERDAEPQAPSDLRERISKCVAAAPAPLRKIESERDDLVRLAEFSDRGVIRIRGFRDIAAVAAMIVLAIGLGVPSLLQVRQRAQRAVCTQNLAGIGAGLQSYAMAHSSSLPFAGWSADNTWRPTDDPALRLLPNRRHVYPLVRAGYSSPQILVCPSTRDVPMSADQVARRDDFVESRNLSYAYQNMAGRRPSLENSPDLPIMGDDNPLFEDGFPLFETLGLSDPARANSRAHGGSGQNVLTIRGTVRWIKSPTWGVDGDNIWTLNDVEEYTGREGPNTTSDAHLLK